MVVFWMVLTVVLVAGLGTAAVHDRRVRARRARLDMAPQGAVRGPEDPSDPRAYWNPGPNAAGGGF